MSGEARNFSRFIGVDLGGGKGRNTAVALLQHEGAGVRVVYLSTRSPEQEPFYDSPLLRFVRRHQQGALLAMDAPLTPTVCVRCRQATCPTLEACEEPVLRWFREKGDELVRASGGRSGRKPPTTPYTQRACEVLLHRRHGIIPRETLGQGMGPLTARAHYLHRSMEDHFILNQNLIEVYPKATVHMLFGQEAASMYKRGADPWTVRAEMLEALGDQLRFEVWKQVCLDNDHCFDAVIAAYTAYLWAVEGWELPEEDRAVFEQDGWIWFPPAKN